MNGTVMIAKGAMITGLKVRQYIRGFKTYPVCVARPVRYANGYKPNVHLFVFC